MTRLQGPLKHHISSCAGATARWSKALCGGALTTLLVCGVIVLPAGTAALAASDTNSPPPAQPIGVSEIVQTIIAMAHPKTRIPSSHWGDPQLTDLAFTYDCAAAALVLHAAGRHEEAVQLLDPFDQSLRLPMETVQAHADTNGVYGIVKIFRSLDSQRPPVVAVINALRPSVLSVPAEGKSEFWTTPGPVAWLLMAMANVDPQRYAISIQMLGEVLRAMQDGEGGVRDGDRNSSGVPVEPHVDAACALWIAGGATTPWPPSAEAAWQWFHRHAVSRVDGRLTIASYVAGDERLWRPATDAYTWTMAGPFGDRLVETYGLGVLQQLSLDVLHNALVEVTWTAPDGTSRTSLLLDYTDPERDDLRQPAQDEWQSGDYGVTRGPAYHPAGSPEWTSGAILAFQKNAVRYYEAWQADGRREAGLLQTATWFKTLAVALEREVLQTFTRVQGLAMSPYATAQNVATGFGWRTPVYYAVTPDGQVVAQGGAVVSSWIVLPMTGLNPFIPGDTYRAVYDQIPGPVSPAAARDVLRQELRHPPFTEPVATALPPSAPGVVEPHVFVERMWEAYNRQDYATAVQLAEKVVDEPAWLALAVRDNEVKRHEVGDVIEYPWGKTFPRNDHPWHEAIRKYRLLNEVGAAMSGAAMASYQQSKVARRAGRHQEAVRYRTMAQYWLRRIILETSLHQIPDPVEDPVTGRRDLIRGYWNLLTSLLYHRKQSQWDVNFARLVRVILHDLKREGLRAGVDYVLPSRRGVPATR